MHEEVLDVLGPDRAVEYTDLPNLKYTEQFINETNRLFPIGPVIVRAHEGDLQIGKLYFFCSTSIPSHFILDDCILPAGSSSVLAIINTHRSEKYWPDPLKFDPDRFLPEEVAKRHPYSFVPFAGGPRMCIGI